jgi:hypothetical protein
MIQKFDEIAAHRTTFEADGTSLVFDRNQPFGTAHRHKPVKVTANGTVGLAGNDEKVFGSLDHIEPDGSVVVVDGGYVRFSGAGTVNLGVVGNTGNIVKAASTGASTGAVVYVGSGYVIAKI